MTMTQPFHLSDGAAKHLPHGARALMGSRKEPRRSRDFFPTPPWATRCLLERVLPELDIIQFKTAWEPACGAGHMAEVLREYFDDVYCSDKYDYKYGAERLDFLAPPLIQSNQGADWIITNPPFRERAEAFVLRSLGVARVGVAMFMRQQWLESAGRYHRVFKQYHPAMIGQFSERVPLHKGKWKPDGATATSYVWIVWLRNRSAIETRTRFFWIPPGQRQALTRPDDRERFTAHPVIKRRTFTSSPGEE